MGFVCGLSLWGVFSVLVFRALRQILSQRRPGEGLGLFPFHGLLDLLGGDLPDGQFEHPAGLRAGEAVSPAAQFQQLVDLEPPQPLHPVLAGALALDTGSEVQRPPLVRPPVIRRFPPAYVHRVAGVVAELAFQRLDASDLSRVGAGMAWSSDRVRRKEVSPQSDLAGYLARHGMEKVMALYHKNHHRRKA